MSNDISIRWNGGERRFGPDETVTIGRDPSCDIVVDNPRVRQHAELRYTADGWTFVDPSSTRGLFVGGTRVGQRVLDQSTTINLGGEPEGERIEVILPERTQFAPPPPATIDGPANGGGGAPPPPVPSPRPPTPTPPPPAPAAPVGAAAAGADRPGGSLRAEPVAPTVVSGQSVSIQCAGKSYTFQPGKEVVIGRDPASDVPVDNPVVSRRHAAIRSTGNGWELADYGSSSGTFVDGERITTLPLRGSMAVYLGPEDVGERLVVVTAGISPPGRRRRSSSSGSGGGKFVVIGLIVALVAVAIAVVALVTRNSGSDGPDLAQLREATVLIHAGDSQGSGAVIDNGLILTNAHVVAKNALGRGVATNRIAADLQASPPEVRISVLRGNSTEPAYIGKVVAADGYLDLAVVRVTATAGGSIVQPDDDLDLETVKLGDSTKLESGDALYAIGYPGIAETSDATVSEGSVGSFLADPRLNDNKAWINTDANIAGGNSGGLAANVDGRIIGTPTAVNPEDRTNSAIARVRPIHLALPLIDAAREGSTYTSPYVRPKGEATVLPKNFVTPSATAGFTLGCETATPIVPPPPGTRSVAVQFDYDKFPVDTHQDVLVYVVQSSALGSRTSAQQFPFPWGNGKGCAVVNLQLDTPLSAGGLVVAFFAGGNYENIGEFSIAID